MDREMFAAPNPTHPTLLGQSHRERWARGETLRVLCKCNLWGNGGTLLTCARNISGWEAVWNEEELCWEPRFEVGLREMWTFLWIEWA